MPDVPLPVFTGRTFTARRKAGRGMPGRMPIYHAVTPGCRMALCATEPGAGSRWEENAGPAVTCPKCLARLGRLVAQNFD